MNSCLLDKREDIPRIRGTIKKTHKGDMGHNTKKGKKFNY